MTRLEDAGSTVVDKVLVDTALGMQRVRPDFLGAVAGKQFGALLVLVLGLRELYLATRNEVPQPLLGDRLARPEWDVE